jgi:hypothetical protein
VLQSQSPHRNPPKTPCLGLSEVVLVGAFDLRKFQLSSWSVRARVACPP